MHIGEVPGENLLLDPIQYARGQKISGSNVDSVWISFERFVDDKAGKSQMPGQACRARENLEAPRPKVRAGHPYRRIMRLGTSGFDLQLYDATENRTGLSQTFWKLAEPGGVVGWVDFTGHPEQKDPASTEDLEAQKHPQEAVDLET